MNKCRRFRQLSPAERRWLISAFAMLPLFRVALRVIGFRRVQSFFGRETQHGRNPASGSAEMALATQMARMVAAASREGLCRGNCLEQSLTLLWLLRRAGLSATLRIGVRKQASGLEAHAWVESGERVLNDGADVYERYQPFHGDFATLQANYR